MSNTTQSFDHLPAGSYYTSGKHYSGLSNVQNLDKNNRSKVKDIAHFSKLKGRATKISKSIGV